MWNGIIIVCETSHGLTTVGLHPEKKNEKKIPSLLFQMAENRPRDGENEAIEKEWLIEKERHTILADLRLPSDLNSNNKDLQKPL